MWVVFDQGSGSFIDVVDVVDIGVDQYICGVLFFVGFWLLVGVMKSLG